MEQIVRQALIAEFEEAVAESPLVTVSAIAAGGGVTTALHTPVDHERIRVHQHQPEIGRTGAGLLGEAGRQDAVPHGGRGLRQAAAHWQQQGAQVSDRVAQLIKEAGKQQA